MKEGNASALRISTERTSCPFANRAKRCRQQRQLSKRVCGTRSLHLRPAPLVVLLHQRVLRGQSASPCAFDKQLVPPSPFVALHVQLTGSRTVDGLGFNRLNLRRFLVALVMPHNVMLHAVHSNRKELRARSVQARSSIFQAPCDAPVSQEREISGRQSPLG